MAKEPRPSLTPVIEAEVNAWFNDTFHNHGPALSEALFAHFQAAKEKLTERLIARIEKEG